MTRLFSSAILVAGLLAFGPLGLMPARGGTNDYNGSRWALVDEAKVLTAAAAISTSAYPNCDMATVEQRSVRVYRADGTGEAQDETYTKVLTEKGRRANRTLSLSFTLPYSTPEVARLEIIKPDGAVEPVDVAANSKETIDDSQMAENIYDPNNRVLQVNIPKLELGDMVHSVTRTTTERPYIPGQFADENLLEYNSLIRHETYEVFAPADRPLQHLALRDEVPGTVTYSAQTNADGSVTHLWTITNVPRMYDEPGMPPYDMVLATPLRQHPARLAGRLQVVLGLEQAASGRHLAGNAGEGLQAHRRRADRPGQNQGAVLLRFQKHPLHGPDAGKGPARIRAA